jgi:hypothetical protein
VLRSWAVPRGLPEAPAGNRLAVAVAHHAIEHRTKQNVDQSIAHNGTREEHDRTDKRLLFTLHGRTGSRRYALIRTDSDWLLHLTKEQPSTVGQPP